MAALIKQNRSIVKYFDCGKPTPPCATICAMTDRCYVSITGLTLNSPWHWPRFMWHAMRSNAQARKVEGNLRAEVKQVGAMYCTLSVWQNQRAMKRFLYQGAHGKAVRDFDNFATGTTYGYEADTAPGWDEALRLLEEHGK
jgi:hypothetical protein